MRLSEPIEEMGIFWLPEEPENRLPGLLRISESGDITLKITSSNLLQSGKQSFGDFFRGANSRGYDRIIGIIKSGQVTLEDCSKLISGSLHGNGLSELIFGVHCVFVGFAYEKNINIMFSELKFSVCGLDEWLRMSGFSIERNKSKDVQKITSINFTYPKPISLEITDEMNLEFSVDAQIPVGMKLSETKITQKPYISLLPKAEQSVDELLSLADVIRNFFSFAVGKAVSLNSITGYSNEIRQEFHGENQRIPIKIFFRGRSYVGLPSKVMGHHILFTYEDIKKDVENILMEWVKLYHFFEPILDRYFGLGFDYNRDPERRFTLLVEGLAAINKNSSKLWENEKNMSKHITKMITPFCRFYGTKDEIKDLVKTIVDTRNDLIHLHNFNSSISQDTSKLSALTGKVEALFQLHLLRMIGIEDLHIKKIVKETATPSMMSLKRA